MVKFWQWIRDVLRNRKVIQFLTSAALMVGVVVISERYGEKITSLHNDIVDASLSQSTTSPGMEGAPPAR